MSAGVAGDHRGVDLALEVPGGEVVDGVVAEAGDPEVEGHASASLPLWMNADGARRIGVGWSA